MDVQKREDQLLDYIGTYRSTRDAAVVELRFLALKHPDLASELRDVEYTLMRTPALRSAPSVG